VAIPGIFAEFTLKVPEETREGRVSVSIFETVNTRKYKFVHKYIYLLLPALLLGRIALKAA